MKWQDKRKKNLKQNGGNKIAITTACGKCNRIFDYRIGSTEGETA